MGWSCWRACRHGRRERNAILFVRGATFPSTPDFDLQYKDYSWADHLAAQGYVVYMFDKRNYGFSSREKAMEEPAAANKPLSRSYLVTNAPVKKHVTIPHATHFVLFEKQRVRFFEEIESFLKAPASAAR